MTRMNVLKHLVCTIIFSSLCITSTYAHEFPYDQPNMASSVGFTHDRSPSATYSSHYEQRMHNAEIKVGGVLAIIVFIIKIITWFGRKKKEQEILPVPQPAPARYNELELPYTDDYQDCIPIIHISDLQKIQTQPEPIAPEVKEKDTHAYFEEMKAQARGISIKAFVTHICRIASDNKKLHFIFEKYNHRFQRSQTQEQKNVLAYIDQDKTSQEDIDQILQAYFYQVDTSKIPNSACLLAQKQAIRKEQWLADTNKNYFCVQCRDIRSKEVKAYTKLHDQEIARTSHCHGTTRQCMLHGELGDIIKAAATIYTRNGDNPCTVLATQCAQMGMLLNKMEDFTAAFCMADMGWALIDMVQCAQDGVDVHERAQELRAYRYHYEPHNKDEAFYHTAATDVMTFIADYPDCADTYVFDRAAYDKKVSLHIDQLASLPVSEITTPTIRGCAHHALQKLIKTRVQEFATAMKHDQYLKKTYVQNISRRSNGRYTRSSRSRKNSHNNTPASPEEPDPDDEDDLLKELKKCIAREVDDATLEFQQALDTGDIEQAQKCAQALGWNEDLTPLYAETDADGIPVICKQDLLLKILSDEQKRELLATSKEKFIALLIKRNEQKCALIKKFELEELVLKYPDVNDFLYELLYLSDEDIAKRIVDLAHELQFMEDGSRKEALQALVDFLMKSKRSDPLAQTFDQYDQEKDMIDEDTHLAQSRAQRRNNIENGLDSQEITTQAYQLSPFLQKLLNFLGIGESTFTKCTGNQIQQAIHRSLIQSLEDMDSEHSLRWDNPINILAAQFAKLAIALNLAKDYNGAMLIADVTAGLVDIRNGVSRAAYHEATDVWGWLFSIGFGGLTLYAAPEVSATVGALGMLYLIGNIVWHAGLLAKDYCLDEKTYDAKVAALREHLTTEQVAEFIAGFFFSYIRDHFAQGILKYFISGIFKSASFIKQLNNIIDQQIKPPPKPPKKPKSKKITSQNATQKKDSSLSRKTRKGSAKSKPKESKKFRSLDKEKVILEKTFWKKLKGFGLLAGKEIDLNMKHYLAPEICTAIRNGVETVKRVKGWHHDPNGFIEKCRKFNGKTIDIISKEVHANGVYVLEWAVEGARAKKSTFFPKNWSRETVLNKIAEAYRYCEKNGVEYIIQEDGRYLITGYTSEGIKIRMVFEPNGKLITAFPEVM